MNKKQKNKKNTPKKVCSTSINETPPAPPPHPPPSSSNVSAAAKPSNQQIRRYYQETAEDYRRADGKSRLFRGNCLCDGRWTCCSTKHKHSSLASIKWSRFILSRSMHDSYASPKIHKWWNKQGWRVKCNIGCRKRGTVDENDFRKHVDKIHPIGGAKNGNQARIIKFTTHSLRRMFFYSISETKKLIMEKREKIQNTSPRCGWTFRLLYPETELTCLEKPMRQLKVMRTSNLLMPICMVIWSLH